ncbi:MAG: hypothetical protein AAAC47_13560, partial [Pararhizobium sp.]
MRESRKTDNRQTNAGEDKTSPRASAPANEHPTHAIIHASETENGSPIFERSRHAVLELAFALRHDLRALWRRIKAWLLKALETRSEQSRNRNTSQSGAKIAGGRLAIRFETAWSRLSEALGKLTSREPLRWVRWRSWGAIFALASLSCALVLASILLWA